MPNYTFGQFVLNQNSNGLGYYLMERELPLPIVKPIQFNIARRDGAKKSGETVDARIINAKIKIIGTSRIDLVSRVDALQQALSYRSQQLCLHEDGRYYQSVDATVAPVKFSAGGGVVACGCVVTFTCYDPYAYSATPSTYDTGQQNPTLSNGTWNLMPINLTGGGTIYSYPLIRLYNYASSGSTTLTAALTSGNTYTSISVNPTPFSCQSGDQILITDGITTQALTCNGGFSVNATTILVNSFVASTNYIVGDIAQKNTAWTSLTVTQSNDNQTIAATATQTTPLPSKNGDYVDIQCDPAALNGWTIQTNSSGVYAEPTGLFPVMEPGLTTFNVGINCPSTVITDVVFSWVPRYLS
jgi:hypothetical protein